ncbi:MAG TPA: ATP-binding protein, partial [Chitinophagaceae bacterium]|nr:ATP-binding protein [Chitinophagaceae bacterium]
LFNRANGTFQRFTTREGLPNNNVLRILEDQHGILWMSTYDGLCKFDPVKRSFRNFTYADGLQSNQFSFNAALSLRSGEFLFGGIKGFNIFHPDSLKESKEVPRVFLSGLKIDNTPIEDEDRYVTGRQVEYVKQIKVPYDKAILSLDFLALDYSLIDKLQYAYQLTGWDKTWNNAGNNRTANYTRIHEGTYVFSVKVMNAYGVWGEETRLLQIIILPPWYRSWWAYILYAVFIIGAFYFYILYNKRQERLRYEIKLAHLESEQEKELTEKKISFFTHISHEFRTPLTLIINPLKELVKENTDEDVHKKTVMIHRNAKRLLSLVDQLLLFRKVESVDQQMRIERFNITEVCNEVYLSFSQHAVMKNIRFTYEKNERDIFIYADKEKIEIILFNLISNAFKYTEAAGEIMLGIIQYENEIEISVSDTGSGIPVETGTKLFESFYQAGNTGKASQTGFGIGLYVSQKLAQAHHGQLSYKSEPGKGTTFRLMLLKGKDHFASRHISEEYKPGQTILHELVEDPEAENLLSEETEAKPNKSTVIDKLTSGLPTMVIVDDNAELRSYIRQVFEGSFNIYEADDGRSGYELVLKETPDIVISDVMMKKTGGIEMVKKIKETPSIAHIPVILLTASSSDEIKLKGIKGGAEDYITKPFDKEIIIARVQNILKGKNRLQQYFFNAVTLKPNSNIAGEHKEFIERCIAIVENHLDDPEFNIQTFCKEIGMSHPSLYKKVKAVSGLTVNVFIRYLRLRKAAELLITTDKTIVEVTYITGFNDIRYFREQFFKLFEMKPSEYV